ncbi:MAG: FAS1 domain-containing protein [Benjaminiella poitrasii]|nr:MAG: FAS1 domain-containing protein [Benjaminiella poitrasii]
MLVILFFFLFNVQLSWHSLSVSAANLMDMLAKDKRFNTLVAHINHFELTHFMSSLDGITLLAPDNDAFSKYEYPIDRSTLLYHVVRKGMKMSDIYDGQLRETMLLADYSSSDKPRQRIKFNIRKDDVYCGGEAKVIDRDIQVNNSTWIQVIDYVIQLPLRLGDTLLQRNKPLYDLMNSTATIDLLNQPKPFTIFVSTRKDIFEKYNAIEQAYLTTPYAQEDVGFYFNYTVIDKAIFMDEFTSGKTTYKSLTGDSLVIISDKKSMSVNGIPLQSTDIIASNGVIHEIDDTFRPAINFTARKYLHGLNGSHMVHWIDQHKLTFLNESNHTFLIPPLDSINQSLVSADWLQYHVLHSTWLETDLRDHSLLKTEFRSDDLNGHRQRLPVYVQHEDIMASRGGTSIMFDKSRMIGDNVTVNTDVIYQVSEPLSLPGDLVDTLAVDLDLSTFIAVLYVSDIIDEFRQARGLTFFVPTNEAFKELGLVAKYLVHKTARDHLQTLLRHHAVPDILYHDQMRTGQWTTMANTTLDVHGSHNGPVTIGPSKTTLTTHDLLVSTGVVHTIDQVQQPFNITTADILTGIEATTMMQVVKGADLWDEVEKAGTVVLVPTDEAFSHVDLEQLMKDSVALDRIARFHLITTMTEWPDAWHGEYSTALSHADKLVFSGTALDNLRVKVKDGHDEARVVGVGRLPDGRGVLLIDAVLVPVRRGLFGLPWVKSIVVVLVLMTVVTLVVALIAFFAYKIYHRRRLGYRPIH